MNCQRFDDVINDVAREQIMDAALRHEAFLHSGECPACAARLNDERALTHQLRDFALMTKSMSAPERVEVHLLEAFNSQSLVRTGPIRRSSGGRYWLAAVAALVLIFCGLFIARSRQARPPRQASATNLPERPESDKQEVSKASSLRSLVEKEIKNQHPAAVRSRSIRYRKEPPLSPASNALGANPLYTEITTDFLPVTYGSMANLDAGGQIVRVELPRATMATFGLPVNMERSDEKIKADVLLGVDGLAHAIRFVGNRRSLDLPK